MSEVDTARRGGVDLGEERLRVERGEKRIRTYLGGELVADTTQPLLVWEVPYYPTYYFPDGDVRTEMLEPEQETSHSPSRGDATVYTVRAGGKAAIGAAKRYEHSPIEALRGAIKFEEDEEVYTHARDPHTRVDILASSRPVRVELDGTIVAQSGSPRLLFETGLPLRIYLPKPHVRMDLLVLADKVTHCPYKGQAQAWSVRLGDRVYENLAWSYPTPLPESERIAGLIAFYNEKVDLFVDGVRWERPSTKFS